MCEVCMFSVVGMDQKIDVLYIYSDCDVQDV